MHCICSTLVVILLQCASPGTDSHFILDSSKIVFDKTNGCIQNSNRPVCRHTRTVEDIVVLPKAVILASAKVRKMLLEQFALDLPLAALGKMWAYSASEDGKVRLINMTIEHYEKNLPSEDYVQELQENQPVRFWLYTRKNKKEYEELYITKLKSEFYRKRKPLIVITHGWISNGETNSTQLIKNALLKKLDANFIIVDWKEIAAKEYLLAAATVTVVGEKICELILRMSSSKKFRVKPRDVHLVGHSLGAHAMGAAGNCLRDFNFDVSRLTGLDPARPFFELPPVLRGLNKKDARFVDVIHTNAGILGVYFARGDADFYPNGGIGQPGCYECLSTTPIVCDHSSSYHFFAESILKDVYEGTQCLSYLLYRLGACPDTDRSPMGFHCDDEAEGKYYLQTPPVDYVF